MMISISISRLSGMTSTSLGWHCSINLPLVLLRLLTMRNLLPYQSEDDEYISQQYILAISCREVCMRILLCHLEP